MSFSTTPAISVGRKRADQHRDDSAARRADEDRPLDAERRRDGEHVLRLDDAACSSASSGRNRKARGRDSRPRSRVRGSVGWREKNRPSARKSREFRERPGRQRRGRRSEVAASKIRQRKREAVLRADPDDPAAVARRRSIDRRRTGERAAARRRRQPCGPPRTRSSVKRERMPDSRAVELQVLHHLLHVVARLVEGDALDPVDRVDRAAARVAVVAHPVERAARAGIVADEGQDVGAVAARRAARPDDARPAWRCRAGR